MKLETSGMVEQPRIYDDVYFCPWCDEELVLVEEQWVCPDCEYEWNDNG